MFLYRLDHLSKTPHPEQHFMASIVHYNVHLIKIHIYKLNTDCKTHDLLL